MATPHRSDDLIREARVVRHEQERDAALAVIEKALAHDPLHGASSGLRCGGSAPCIRAILSSVPADVLRERDAEKWDEGFADGRRQDAEGDDGPRFTNPYRIEQNSEGNET